MVVGKPDHTTKKQKHMFDFTEVGLNLDIKFFITE